MTDHLLPLAQQTMPIFDGMYWLMLVSRVLHILGAIILVGGLRAKWAMWVGIATLLLIVTGLWNFINIIKTYDVASSYHMIFGLKMLAAVALFLLAALVAGRSPAAETLRQKMRFWLGVCLALGILTVALGSILRSYPHNPKIDAAGPPMLVAPTNPSPTQ